MNILIVSGGKLHKEFARDYLAGRVFDHIIAADQGLAYCHTLGLTPTEILGDFDSIEDKDLVKMYEADGVPVNRFPSHKDFSDTELAVARAIALADRQSEKEHHVVMLACTGTRYDHSLANMGLLERFCHAGIDAVIADDHNEIRMAVAGGEKTAAVIRKDDRYGTYSLIPWGGDVTRVTLQGFAYPLTDHTIKASESLCVSNELEEETGVITFEKGKLLVIKARD